MLSVRVIFTAMIFSEFGSTAFADEFLLQSDIGRGYAQVRQDLLGEGNSPLDQTKNLHRQCIGSEGVCSEYKEDSGCAVDRDSPCRFEWKSKSGRRFYIITFGNDPKNLIVMGMDYDQPGDD